MDMPLAIISQMLMASASASEYHADRRRFLFLRDGRPERSQYVSPAFPLGALSCHPHGLAR